MFKTSDILDLVLQFWVFKERHWGLREEEAPRQWLLQRTIGNIFGHCNCAWVYKD